jgi:L-fuconolactonase
MSVRIDAHVHFWRPSCGFDNRPIADHEAYRRDFLPADLAPALAESRIDGVVLVQSAPQVAETDWMLSLDTAPVNVLGVTAWVDLESPECDLDRRIADPRVVGIRAQLRRVADQAFIARPNVVRNLARALDAGLNVTILAEVRHHAHVIPVLDRLPAGPITINHLGLPFPDLGRDAWHAGMKALSRRPDLYVQLSGVPFLFQDRWREGVARPVLDAVFDLFGPRRLMFASDYPMLLRFATYAEWVQAVERELAARRLSDAEIEAIFSGNVQRANPRLRLPSTIASQGDTR